MRFDLPAIGLQEQRAERKRTIDERCEMVAELVNDTGEKAVVWCALNVEGDKLEKLIPDAEQVSGKDNDDAKEAKFESFSNGGTRILITKPKIGAWGLNWQHCNHLTFFPSHSYEQYYQAVRRCWRFGQERPVMVDIVATKGDMFVQENLQKKADQADKMFTELVAHMNDSIDVNRLFTYNKKVEVPSWLS
jgi:superfamily II DNA or RNA helicase